MAKESPYKLPEPARKVCDLFRLLAGHELLGLAPGEIAKGLGVQPSWVSQNLPPLAEQTGFVERVADTNRWRLGVPLVRIAFIVMNAHAESKRRLAEVGQRYDVPV